MGPQKLATTIWDTLPKTNKAPENRPSHKKFSLPTIHLFRCYVSFRQGIRLRNSTSIPKIFGANLVRDKINSCQLTFREHNSFGKSQNIAAKCSKCKLCAIVGRPILFWEWFISTNRWMHLGEVNAAKTYCEFLRCYLQMWCFTCKRGKFPLKWSPPPPPELSACSCVLLPKNGIFPSFTLGW